MPKKSVRSGSEKSASVPYGLAEILSGSCPQSETNCPCGTVLYELGPSGQPSVVNMTCTDGCVEPGGRGFTPEEMEALKLDDFCMYTRCCVPPDTGRP